MIRSKVKARFNQLNLVTDAYDLTYMEKSKKKVDYINDLLSLVEQQAKHCTVKQLRKLLAKHALS